MYPSKMIGNKTWQLTSHFDHTSTLHLPQIRWLLWCYCKSPSAHSHSTRNWDHAALPLKILKLASLNQSLQKIRKKIPSYYVVQCCKQVARVWFLNQIFRSYSVVIDARLTLCRYIATTFTTFKRSFEHLYIWLSNPHCYSTSSCQSCALYSVAVFLLKRKPTLLPKKWCCTPLSSLRYNHSFLSNFDLLLLFIYQTSFLKPKAFFCRVTRLLRWSWLIVLGSLRAKINNQITLLLWLYCWCYCLLDVDRTCTYIWDTFTNVN